MNFTEPILEGKFLKRYKRFFADVGLKEGQVVAHVPNTGSLKGCLSNDIPCLVMRHADPERKLKFTLQMVKNPKSWVGVNTALSNKLVWEAWEAGGIKDWKKLSRAQREVKINEESRLDMVLWNDGKTRLEKIGPKDIAKGGFHCVEVKNVTMAENDVAYFPDSVTTRGQKHLKELMKLIKRGNTSEIIFTVQREDCAVFAPADHIDEDYGTLLRQAQDAGVIISAYACTLNSTGIHLQTAKKLKLKL